MFNYDQIIEKAAVRKDALKAFEEAVQIDTCNTIINELAEVHEYLTHLNTLFKSKLDEEGRGMLPKEVAKALNNFNFSLPYLESCLKNLRELRDQLHGE